MCTNVVSLCNFVQKFVLGINVDMCLHVIGSTDMEFSCSGKQSFDNSYFELIELLNMWSHSVHPSNVTVRLVFVGPELIAKHNLEPIVYKYDGFNIQIMLYPAYYHECTFNHKPDMIIMLNAGIYDVLIFLCGHTYTIYLLI